MRPFCIQKIKEADEAALSLEVYMVNWERLLMSLLQIYCRCQNLETPRAAPQGSPFDSSVHSGRNGLAAAKLGNRNAPRKESGRGAQQEGPRIEQGAQPGGPNAANAAAASNSDSAVNGLGAVYEKAGGLRAWLAARRDRIRQARAARGMHDLEAASLGPAQSADANAESAFRIWSLPNEGAITTDPYSKVTGSVERNESRPPSRNG